MSNKIGAKIVLDGEAEYKRALKGINTEQRELRSEMKLVSSEFSNQQNSIQALTRKNEILTKQYDSQNRKVEIYSQAVKEASKAEQEAEKKVDELKTALDTAQKEMTEMAESSDTSKEALEAQEKVIEDLKNKLNLAQQGYSTAQNATNEWQTSLNTARTTLNQMENELAENNRHLAEAERSTDNTAHSIDEYGREVDSAKEKTMTFGDVLKANLTADLIKKGVQELVDSIKKISTATIEVGKNFESGMSQVAATMGITTEQIAAGSRDFEMLSKAAKDAGKSTQYSASQSAEALNYLALAGYDATKACETLPKVLNLAAAGGMELGAASDLVTDSMAALGMEVSELDNYIDEMAKTSQKSNTSVAQLGEATLVCAGTVSLTNQSLETMNAELGILANNGIKSAEGGTHLRNILLSLVAPTSNGATALKELGVNVKDSFGNMRDLNNIMVDLNKSMTGMSDTAKTNYINDIFNKTDIAAVNALLKGTGKEFNNLKGELLNCKGAAQDMANTMNDNLAGKVTILQSALEGLGISAYEKIEGTLKKSVDAATESVGNLQIAMDDGELGRAMDDFSDALADATTGAIEFAEDALPVMIDGLTWVLDNADLVAAGIAGITAAEVAHGTVVPLITATMEAWRLYKIENEGATIAQWALNTAMNANPVGIIVTAIAGATAALATYALTAKEVETVEQKYAKAAEEMEARLKNNAEKRKEAIEQQKVESITVRKLKSELMELTSEEELSTSKKQEMAGIIAELNELVPDLNLYYDEEKQSLSMTNDEIERYIENSLKAAEVDAMKEQLADIAREYAAADIKLAKAQKEHNDAVAEAEEFYNNLIEAQKRGVEGVTELEQAIGTTAESALSDFEEKTKSTAYEVNNARKELEILETEYNNVSELCNKASEELDEQKKAYGELGTVMLEYKGKVHEVSSEVATNMSVIQEAYDEAKAKAYDSINSQIGLFDDLVIKSEMSINQMNTNLEHQADAINTYAQDLQAAADLVEQGLLDEGMLGAIRTMGIDGAGYLHELVTAAEGDTEQFNELMNTWADLSEAKDKLAGTMADIETNYSTNMDALIKVNKEKGNDLADGVAKNFEKIPSVAENALNIKGGISIPFVNIGYAMDKGVEKGILDGMPSLVTLTKKSLLSCYDAGKEVLDIHSPSKKFGYLGKMSGEGFQNELIESMDETKEKVRDAINDIVDCEDDLSFSSHERFADVVSAVETESENMRDAISSNVKALSEEELAVEKTRQSLFGYINGEKDITEASGETIEQLQKLSEKYTELEEESVKSIESQVKLFDKLEMKSEMSVSQMIDNLKSQIDYFNTYASDLTKAAGLVEQGLLDKGVLGAIQTMGLDGAKYLHELVNAATDDTNSFNEVMTEWSNMQSAKELLSTTMTTIKMLYGTGMDEVLSVQTAKGSEIESKVEETNKNVKSKTDESFKELVSSTGSSISEMTDTVVKKTPEFEAANAKMCSAALDSCKTTLMIDESGVSKSFVAYGYTIPDSIALGISEHQDSIAQALQAAFDNAANSIDLSGLLEKIDLGLGELMP